MDFVERWFAIKLGDFCRKPASWKLLLKADVCNFWLEVSVFSFSFKKTPFGFKQLLFGGFMKVLKVASCFWRYFYPNNDPVMFLG